MQVLIHENEFRKADKTYVLRVRKQTSRLVHNLRYSLQRNPLGAVVLLTGFSCALYRAETARCSLIGCV